jgi:hypothetical protein
MKKVFFSLLVISQIAFSQTEKEVGDFNKVTSFDKIDVLLVPSNENKVVLVGDNSEIVEVGELKIRMPLTKLLSGDGVSATVYFKEIDAVEANEGSRIACETTFDTTIFDVIAKEGSEIKIKINVEKLNLRVANGSTVSISGKANYQDVIVNSGGNYEAEKLTTKQTTITSNAGGNATIFATNLVDAKVRAGGKILIHGNPKQINQKIIAGGRIEEVK